MKEIITVEMYAKDKKGNYSVIVERGKYLNINDAKLRANALNWAYKIISIERE